MIKLYNRLKKVIVSMLVITLLISQVGYVEKVSFAFSGFSDVQGNYAEQIINEWGKLGYISGFADGTFAPNAPITRAEFLTLISSTLQIDASNSIQTAAEAVFTDVTKSDWYYENVMKAYAFGIVSGYPNGTFNANAPISRQDACVILGKYLELGSLFDASNVKSFTDEVDIFDYAYNYVGALADMGFIHGFPSGDFMPKDNIVRADAVALINGIKLKVRGEAGIIGKAYTDELVSSNVKVAITKVGDFEPVSVVNTDVNGFFEVDLEIGEYNVVATKDDKITYASSVLITDNKRTCVNLEMKKGKNVVATLYDPEKGILKNTTVYMKTNPYISVTSDNYGKINTFLPVERDYEIFVADKSNLRSIGKFDTKKIGEEKVDLGLVNPSATPPKETSKTTTTTKKKSSSHSSSNRPVVTTYQCTIEAGTGGSIVKGASGRYTSGAAISLEATANTGYDFVNWTSSNGGTFDDDTSLSTQFVMPSNSTVVSANFTAKASEVQKFNLDIKVEEGGTLIQGTSGMYTSGSAITIEVTPESGYTFDGWVSSNGGKFDNASDEKTVFTMPENATEISATFDSNITPDLNLSVTDKTILYGEDSNEITVYLSTNVSAESIPLYEGSSLVGHLYDDGDLDEHGDDMLGDGVYSAVYVNTHSTDTVLSFSAQYGGKISNVEEVNIYTPISNETLVQMETVDNSIMSIVDSVSFETADLDTRKTLVDTQLNSMSELNLIEGDSTTYSDESGVISFEYTGGALGGVMIKDFDETSNGALGDDTSFEFLVSGDSTGTASVELGNAIILNAFPDFETETDKIDFRSDFYEDLESVWDSNGLETTLDTAVTIEDYKNLDDYDVAIIATHGSTYDWRDGFLWKDYHKKPAICLTEKSTKEKDKMYSKEIKDKQIAKVTTKRGVEYWILPKFIENAYDKHELDGTFIFSETCEFEGKDGDVDDTMSEAFESRSAEAVVGFHNSVYAHYSREFMKTYVNELLEAKTAKEAFDAAVEEHGSNHKEWYEKVASDDYDDSKPIAYPILNGDTGAALYQVGIKNGDFDTIVDAFLGYPISWSRNGDVRSVSQLGELSPQTGKHMAIISTGIGSKETAAIDIGVEGSVMSQTFIMPEGSTSLSFSYNFVSEEPLEYVGTEFNDSFAVRLRCGDEDISNKTYESINTSTWMEVSDIDFYDGDDTVYHTGWKNTEINFADFDKKVITIDFIIYDVGDSLYDSACLIDNVQIQ